MWIWTFCQLRYSWPRVLGSRLKRARLTSTRTIRLFNTHSAFSRVITNNIKSFMPQNMLRCTCQLLSPKPLLISYIGVSKFSCYICASFLKHLQAPDDVCGHTFAVLRTHGKVCGGKLPPALPNASEELKEEVYMQSSRISILNCRKGSRTGLTCTVTTLIIDPPMLSSLSLSLISFLSVYYG